MNKPLDRTFDLSDEGMDATCRVRLFEGEPGEERVLIVSWNLRQPGLPVDRWLETAMDEWMGPILASTGPLLLVEYYPRREYLLNCLIAVFDAGIRTARLRPSGDGRADLLDFDIAGLTQEAIEERIGEPLGEPTGHTAQGGLAA